jgi:hypothetical protein
VKRPLACLVLTLTLAATPSLAQESAPLPFSMPVPEGWRTETIPFPLEFAPDLPYTGLEELRFAPGMFDAESAELWSYAFVWWIGWDEPVDLGSLERHLVDYFRGLAKAVGEAREVEVPAEAGFEASVGDDGEGGFRGHAETFDAFVTRHQIRLNLSGRVVDCQEQERRAVLFALSPQAPGHEIWKQLDTITRNFGRLSNSSTGNEPCGSRATAPRSTTSTARSSARRRGGAAQRAR